MTSDTGGNYKIIGKSCESMIKSIVEHIATVEREEGKI